MRTSFSFSRITFAIGWFGEEPARLFLLRLLEFGEEREWLDVIDLAIFKFTVISISLYYD